MKRLILCLLIIALLLGCTTPDWNQEWGRCSQPLIANPAMLTLVRHVGGPVTAVDVIGDLCLSWL